MVHRSPVCPFLHCTFSDWPCLSDGADTSTDLPHYMTCRFHNNSESSGEGAPHSFTAFLHSYPALPQVIVRLSNFASWSISWH